MLSGDAWLQFTEARRSLKIRGIGYDPTTQSGAFTLDAPIAIDGLTILLPLPRGLSAGARAKVTASDAAGNPVPLSARMTYRRGQFVEIVISLEENAHVRLAYSIRR